MTAEERNMYYCLGLRDGYATVLAEAHFHKVRLPWLAKDFEVIAKETHFSHDYHMEEKS